MSPISPRSISSQRGVVLIEALVAILLFSIGVLAVAGLQASMIRNTSDTKYRADASYIAQQKIGQMWTSPDNYNLNLGVPTDIPEVLPNGTVTVTQPAVGQFLITVNWQPPGDPVTHNYSVLTGIIPAEMP
ncbi:MAG: prepilin-type cleavage/methylation domain-containing protein [Sideroxyarcus sp.]